MHLFHTVGILWSFKKKNCVTQYFVNCGVPIFLAGLYSIVADCVTLY